MSEEILTVPLYTIHVNETQPDPMYVTFSKAKADEIRFTIDDLESGRYCFVHDHGPHEVRRLLTFHHLPDDANRGFVGGVALQSVSLLHRDGKSFLTDAGQLVEQGCNLDRLPKLSLGMIAPQMINLPDHPTFVIVGYDEQWMFIEQVRAFLVVCKKIAWCSWITNKRNKAAEVARVAAQTEPEQVPT